MKTEIVWTEEADSNYQSVRKYLKETWGLSSANNFSRKVEDIIELIKSQPEIGEIFPDYKGVRKKLVTRYNYIYYKFINETLNIINFTDTRQNPKQ